MTIEHPCDFCEVESLEYVYAPINSARGMEVFVCNVCGLAQSFSTLPYKSRPPGSMSADADRSSYRYTKDVISGRYEDCFSQYVYWSEISNVLDVGSNRGAFINYLNSHHPGKRIVGIETDASVTLSYATMSNVSVQICRFEDSQLPDSHFDFAYCAHTLEHARSAREMLLGVRRALKPGGRFFIAVPSLIFYRDAIEEFFIDPHTYHFNFHLLRDFASQIGFTVEFAGDPSAPEVTLLLRRTSNDSTLCSFVPRNDSLALTTKLEIDRYARDIHRNREALKDSAELLLDAVSRFKVVIWGGGRILDALVRFGKLDLSKVYLVVDKYLHRYADNLHGCPLKSPDTIKNESPNDVLIYIASREYANEIQAEASSMGFKNFIRFLPLNNHETNVIESGRIP